jgi:lambda repressor-like predicted transcriptional regulator
MGQLSNHDMHSRLVRLHAHLGDSSTPRITKPQVRRQRQRRLRPAEISELTAAYQAGAALSDLASSYQVRSRTVANALERAGVPRRYRRLSTADVDEAVQLYQAGQSLAIVGQHFQVHPGTILHHLRRVGVQMRDTHGKERYGVRLERQVAGSEGACNTQPD